MFKYTINIACWKNYEIFLIWYQKNKYNDWVNSLWLAIIILIINIIIIIRS